jgi:CRISPR-associated protein Csx3
MGTTYNVVLVATSPEVTDLKVSFGAPAQNDTIVRDAHAAILALGELGGKLVRVNGPASLPVAAVLAHHLDHRFGAVAFFDPKLNAYVVAISHDPAHELGSLIPA